jgi:enoyl-CoA hydratase/carnithine racemase
LRETLLADALHLAKELASGPTLGHAMTKKMLHREWAMDLDAALDAEAVAQAQLMESNDFRRAYEAFSAKQTPVFEGN